MGNTESHEVRARTRTFPSVPVLSRFNAALLPVLNRIMPVPCRQKKLALSWHIVVENVLAKNHAIFFGTNDGPQHRQEKAAVTLTCSLLTLFCV